MKATEKNAPKPLSTIDSYVSLALGLAVVLLAGALVFNYFTKKGGTPSESKGESTQEATVSSTLPTTHQVTEGETLWQIAENYYKSGYNWVDIQKANNIANPDEIEKGQMLTIPDVKAITVSGEISATATAPRNYTVQKGDYLWKIALDTYGSGFKWVDISRANNLANPNLIHPGNILTLP